MKTIIVEDEKIAQENLERLLLEINPDIEILAKIDTVKKTVAWLKNNSADLLFFDIHLADDISFKIFEQINIDTPVIFTTAFDQYALKAFKVNSIDYLLKPIEKEELASAIEKYKSLNQSNKIDVGKLQEILNEKENKVFQKRFLVQSRGKLMSVKIEDVAYFEGEDRYVYLIKKDGGRFIVDYKLSDLEDLLDPANFFRLNRSFIAHFDAIEKIVSMSKSRVKVYLNPAASRDIVVSTENTRGFKLWLNA
ncbi:MAG: LytTR family DNA-binding domain-containing protein [Bacteroidota bacterium]